MNSDPWRACVPWGCFLCTKGYTVAHMGSKILWVVTLGFLAGVLARSYLPLGHAYAFFILLLALTLVGASYVYDRARIRGNIVIALALIAVAGGIERMSFATLSGDPSINANIGTHVALAGYVFAEPDAREDSTRISLEARTMRVGSSTISVHARILTVLPPHARIRYGDEVEVSGVLRIPESFNTGVDRSFNYPGYLAVRQIGYQLSNAHIDSVGNNDGNTIYAFVIRFKQAYIVGLHDVLPEPESGLAGGITVGDKRSIGPELTSEFQRTSLIHMLVLSGYNITIVLNGAASILGSMPRGIQLSASGFVVIFFILLSGGASSALRAGIMALIAVYARQHHRTYIAARAIALVAAGMALWNPFIVAFDPSFQLSALATIGLIAYTPIFAVRMQWLTARCGLREIAASTLATQLTVLPFLLYQNGQLSLVALPANILALAPIPFAMAASAIAALGGIVAGNAAMFIALPAYVLLAYIITVTHFFASLPFAVVSVGAFGFGWLAASYAILFIVWYHVNDESGRA